MLIDKFKIALLKQRSLWLAFVKHILHRFVLFCFHILFIFTSTFSYLLGSIS